MPDPLPTDDEYSQFEQDLEDIGVVERDSQAPSLSNVSFSTNATGSNLPGTGRVLGNSYEYVGLLLETVICIIALSQRVHSSVRCASYMITPSQTAGSRLTQRSEL